MSGQVIAAESNRVLALIVLLSVLALVVLLWARRRRNRPSGPEYAPGLATATASTVDELLGSFLDWLHRTAPADPFDPQVVLVPNAGMAEYLEAAVRADARFGVCTNVEFVFPGRLRQRSGVAAIWPFSVDETMWLVLRALEDEELATACGLRDRLAERPLAVARHIAELFERYHSYRPQMLAAWRDGEYLDDRDGQALDQWFRWQCDLFRAIDAIAPTPDVAPRDLPNRIALFGLGAPVGALAEVVHALEVDTEIAAFLLVPGALPPALERWRAPAIAALEHFDEGAPTPGPCRLPVGELHQSYGAPREFDAVRDALLERLDADPTLTARDVTVIAPSIQQSAPIAVPVLSTPLVGHSEQAPRRLPVRVTDRVPALSQSVGSALDALLLVAASRCGPSDVLGLLSFEPVANRFGLDPDAVTLVTEWAIDGLDVRWGLDGDHRTRWGYEAGIDVGAWAPAVDRLLIGMLVQDPTGVGASLTSDPSRPIVPYDDLGGSHIETVGRFAEFLHAVARVVADCERPAPLTDWADRIDRMVQTFLVDDSTTRAEVNAVRAFAHDLRRSALGIERPITTSEIQANLALAFEERIGSARNRFDAVAVSGLRARRGVPHRLTAIVGVDDDVARAGVRSGDDILVATRGDRAWETDRAQETRLGILDAILATRPSGTQLAPLIISTTGWDIVTNKELGLPIVIEELAEAIPSLTAPTRHARRLADEDTFDPTGALWAAALGDTPEPGTDVVPVRSDPTGTLGVRDLTAAYRNPHDLYLREGLDASLPPESTSREESVDLDLDPLRTSRLAGELLGHLARGGDPVEWRIAVQRRVSLPPRGLGDAALERLVGWVDDLITAAGGAVIPTRTVRVQHEVAGRSIDAEIDVVGETIVSIHAARLHARHLIEPWMTLALLTIAEPTINWRAHVAGLIQRDVNKVRRRVPTCRVLTLRTGAADGVLAHALSIRTAALARPIPLFPRATTAHALGTIRATGAGWSPSTDDGLEGDFAQELDYDLERASTAWFYGGSTPALLSLSPATDRERVALGVDASISAAEAYVRSLRTTFTETASVAISEASQ